MIALLVEAVEVAAAKEEEDAAEAGYGADDGTDDDEESEDDMDREAREERKKHWKWREALGDDWTEGEEAESAARAAYLMEKLHNSLLEHLTFLSRDNAKHRSRRERRDQRIAFKEVLTTVEAGTGPVTEVRIRTSVAELSGWGARIQLAVLREVLGEGLQVQLEFNGTVRSILGIRGTVARGKSTLSKVEKRAFFSPNSSSARNRTADRASGRNLKQASQRAFLAED